MHYCKEVAEMIELYRECTSKVLKDFLGDRITDEELIEIEFKILLEYHDGLEADIFGIKSPQKSITT